MYTITQIPKPSRPALGVHLFDPRIVVADVGNLTSNTDPVLCAAVLKGHESGLVVVQVFELLGVVVGQKLEVGAVTLGDLHGAGDWADARAVGGEQADA